MTTRNPPWVVKVLKDIWPILLRRVTDPDLLPKYGPTTGEEGKNLGCGHYGCVMPTNTPGMVCKITTDITEAKFVQAALTLYRDDNDVWPAGMIRYFGVYQIPGKKFRNRPIYVIWRAEAPREHDFSKSRRDIDIVELAKMLGGKIRNKVMGKPKIIDEMFKYLPTVDVITDIADILFRPFFGSGAIAAAKYHKTLENVLMTMRDKSNTYYIGEAMEYYLHEGILLADVHMNNIRMAIPEDFSSAVNVISDPGHAVFLDPRWADIRIPVL